MPRTVDEGFRDFLYKLTPSNSESRAAKSHRESIESCLKAKVELSRFFRTGSFGNGTSISGYSDVDYFASISENNLSENSTIALTQVRDALDTRFPRTGVRVNCPAVKVPFGTEAKENTEVVPAKLHSVRDEHLIYEIPDCSGGWMFSSPDAHNTYVHEVNQKLGGKVKPLIRFIKAWKFYQQVPISSFYLELRVAKYAEGESSILYYFDVKRVFSLLHGCNLGSMQDPVGISGYIKPCLSDVKLEEARSKVATALSRAEKAFSAKSKGDIKEAFSWWNLLYNGNFPSYYK